MKDFTGTISGGTLRQHVKYEYDTFNRRVARWVDTNGNGTSEREEFYIYDGDDVVLDFVDANGATGGLNPVVKTRYLHGPAVDQILAQEDADTNDVLGVLTDHLGSVRDIVNHEGEAVSHVVYDAFGVVIGGTGVLLTRYLWTGREFDTLTGLQYNRNRWYDPTLGRWISEDPIGFGGRDANLYRYAWNDLLQFTDPSGLVGIVPRNWFDDDGNYVGPPKPPFHEYIPDWIEDLFSEPDLSDLVHPIGVAAKVVTKTTTTVAKKCVKEVAGEAAENRAKNIAKGIPESQLGPSGKPKIYAVDHATRKKAKEAARADGYRKPLKHPNDIGQPPHFHAVDKYGNKIGKQSPHHNYPASQR